VSMLRTLDAWRAAGVLVHLIHQLNHQCAACWVKVIANVQLYARVVVTVLVVEGPSFSSLPTPVHVPEVCGHHMLNCILWICDVLTSHHVM
jgi:hypothetical protein